MIKRTFLLLLPVILISSTVYCQEEFIPPPSRFITKFPFTQLTGGIVVLKARLDLIPDTLNFILDTGSGGISLDSTTAAYYHFTVVKSNKMIRGIAGTKSVDFTYNHSIVFPGLRSDSLHFHINDYDLLSSVYGMKIDGIIGLSFLRRYILKIDYDSNMVKVYTPGSFKYPKSGYLFHPMFMGLPNYQATLEDEKTITDKFIFDTGAGLCFLFSKEFTDDSLFIGKKRKLYATVADGLGGKRMMNTTVIKEAFFGPYHFKKVPVYIFDDDYNATSYPLLGGLIGNELLHRFNVIINYPDQTIHIKPNSHFDDPFDYSYTGLGIYLVDGNIRVSDIMPGSPGDRAGFRENDIIFAVNNNFTRNIQAYKAALQNAGTKVTVLILRDNQPFSLSMKIKDISKN